MKYAMSNKRGVASLMAMLFLVIFGVLAVGFYATTNLNVQVVHNELRSNEALMAAESGMEFIRYHLKNVTVPHGTTQAQLFDTVATDLRARLDGTPNLPGGSIYASGGTIRIPSNQSDPSSPGAWVKLDESGRKFRIQVSQEGEKMNVKVFGKYGAAGVAETAMARGVKLEYAPAQNASAVFNYGVASRGRIVTNGSSRIKGASDPKKGSVLSTHPTDPMPVSISGKEVSGDISVSNPAANVYVKGGSSVGGTTSQSEIFDKHVHVGVPAPEFPTIDTNIFRPFVTKSDGTLNYYTGGSVLDNVVIPANSNLTFSGGVTIRGVLYIETPNNIQFRGNTDITGVIVSQNNPIGTPSSNVLDFAGNVTANPVTALPSDSKFDGIRDLPGAFILAPGFHASFTGSFGTVGGSIIASKVSMTGNAGGTILGSVIGLDQSSPLTLNGSSEIVIASTGTSNYPPGVYFSDHYAPLKDTYEEFKPE